VAIDRDKPAAIAAELQRRLRVLVELASARDALHDSQTQVESARTIDPETEMLLLPEFDRQLDRLVEHSRTSARDVSVICLCVELKLPNTESWDGEREQRLKAIGRILSTTIRLEDLSCRSDMAEFCVATPNTGTSDMLRFASRLRKVLENTDPAGPGVEVWSYIGIATLSEDFQRDAAGLRFHAQKRARQALESHSRRIMVGSNLEPTALGIDTTGVPQSSLDINLALALIQSGRSAEVVPHLPLLLKRLGPLFRLIHEQQRLVAARSGSGAETSADTKPGERG
jgi:diguanylate cyclase (GGDEF)-like protein